MQIEALDDVDLSVRVLVVFEVVPWGGVLGVVDVAAVWRVDGLAEVLLLIGALGELDAAAAGVVVEPELSRTEAAGLAFGCTRS